MLKSIPRMTVQLYLPASLGGGSGSVNCFKQKNWFGHSLLLLQTMPLSASVVPIYSLVRGLGVRNSYIGLILVQTAIELPFLSWLLS